jgi:uncharacterized glyoxalase superfamily protein PhnB
MKSLVPNLMVTSVNDTIAFYHDVLGFEIIAKLPETGTHVWAFMNHGGALVMFQEKSSLVAEIPELANQKIGGSLTLYVSVPDVRALFERVKGKARLVADMHTTFYEAEEFAIADCNGYILVFAQHKE